MYLEPWHADVFEFLELKKNTGKEEQRARDLFYGMWIPDLFMKRVESNQVGSTHGLPLCLTVDGLSCISFIYSPRYFLKPGVQ